VSTFGLATSGIEGLRTFAAAGDIFVLASKCYKLICGLFSKFKRDYHAFLVLDSQ
jgi:hypothetical protein